MTTYFRRVLVVLKEDHPGRWRRRPPLYQGDRRRGGLNPAKKEAARAVLRALKKEGLQSTLISRSELQKVCNFDLVVTVGGDGTFLTAARFVLDVPILGVNSNPDKSEGFFTCGSAAFFARLLQKVAQGTVRPTRVVRLEIARNGRIMPYPVLNEILIAHAVPASMSHYQLFYRGSREYHRCSGMWIATPAGSTGAIRSAGGKTLDLSADAFQFVVREPYQGRLTGPITTRGMVKRGETLGCISDMDKGYIYFEGGHLKYRFAAGERIDARVSDHPLAIYGLQKSAGAG